MDFTGGLFSFGQLGLEVIFGMDVKINVVKFVLGIMVMVYDIGFMVQHYCLYNPKNNKDSKEYVVLNDEVEKKEQMSTQVTQVTTTQ